MRRILCALFTFLLTLPLLANPTSGGTLGDPASEPAVIAVSKVWPAVVNVNTERIIRRTVQDPYDQLFNQFFGGEMRPPRELRQKLQSLGSGFLVGPTGYIVTNEHVVERAADMKIHVTMSDGKVYEAHYVTGDPSKDIALLKVDPAPGAKPYPYISLTDLSPDLLGETTLAVGNPLGYGLSVSRGIVSALNRSVTVDEVEYQDLIQTDAAINPGNSGGPLIDIGGKLIGLNSVKMSFTPQGVPTQGIGFAIPGNEVRDAVKEFMAQANAPAGLRRAGAASVSAARRLFGLQLQDLTADLSDALGVPNGQGVVVSDVDEGGPAYQVGIRAGMVIVKVGRFDVNSVGEAESLFSKAGNGDEADLTVLVTQRGRSGRLLQSEQVVSLKAK
ncbi:MAG TPA: trypsin-like peptidase domain-containing protein [Chthoniobacteraceae bacterium]|jgi:S1-C subfamily serine protease|nr:trypsin-like peptidase domain-containing protein [Chthoniobacteraceae bacterium]